MSLYCQILLKICIFKHTELMMQLAVLNFMEVLIVSAISKVTVQSVCVTQFCTDLYHVGRCPKACVLL